MSEQPPSLIERLTQFQRRAMSFHGLIAAGWAVVAAVILGLLVGWLDLLWELSAATRAMLPWLLLLAAALVIAAWCARAIAANRLGHWARRLDALAGSEGEVLTGYTLIEDEQRLRSQPPLTHSLAALAVQRAEAISSAVADRQATPSRALKQVAAGVGGVGLVLLALTMLFPTLANTQWLRFIDPHGDHPPYSRITFEVEPGHARVLYGRGVDIYATPSGASTDRVELVLRYDQDGREEVLPMFREPSSRWRTLLTRVTDNASYHVRAGRSRSHQYQIEVLTVPKIVDVRFKVSPPDYARRPIYEGRLPQGGIVGLRGTSVEVTAVSNRPLASGNIALAAGDQSHEVRLTPLETDPTTVRGTFVVTGSGKFELTVTDVAGQTSDEPLAGSVTLLPDEAPFVRILQPPANSYATPDSTLPVSVSGEDDCGISRLQLFRSLNDSRATPLDFELPATPPLRIDAAVALPLSAYGLSAGDVIKLFARVEDNDPAGTKGSESPIVRVQIISQQDFERMVRARESLAALSSKYHQAERRLESIAAEQRELRDMLAASSSRELNDAMRAAMERMVQRLTKESREIRKSAEHLLPFDLDANLIDRLLQLASSLEAETNSLEQADLQTMTREEALKLLEELLKQLTERGDEFDRDALEPLAELELIYPLIEDQSRFAALVEQQRDLAERLASIRGTEDQINVSAKARMRTFEEEQRQLREALQDLLDDIENHASRLPDDEELSDLRATALRFVDEVRASGATEAMRDAESSLTSFAPSDAHAAAVRAAEILEQFLQRFSQQNGLAAKARFRLSFQPGLSLLLGETVDQLLAEAGLGPGGRNGFSTRRSTLNNVGLYGQLPGMDQLPNNASQRQQAANDSIFRSRDSSDNAQSVSSGNVSAAAGAAAAGIPPRYRGRVGAYFQRIVDDSQSASSR